MIGERPANYAPTERIENDRQVQPAFPGADVGDVSHPQSIWRGRSELALDQVRCLGGLIRDRGAAKAPRAAADQLGSPHQACDALARDASAALAQLGMHTGCAIRAVALVMNGADLFGEPFVGLSMG